MKNLLQDILDMVIEFYNQFLEIAPLLIIALVLSTVFLWISKMLRKRLMNYLISKSDDRLQMNFLSDIFKIINGFIGILLFLYIIGKQGVVASILGAGAVSAFVIGFAFKDIGENFLAGIILAFKRPFRIGDTVMINAIEGSVIDLNLRETHIKTFDGKDVFIPNGIIIKNPLHNYTMDGFLRQQFSFGFDYGTDLQLARSILLETTNKVPGVLQENKTAKTMIQDAGLYKITLVVQYWLNTTDKNYSGTEVKSEAIKNSLLELAKHGIEITSQKVSIEESISK